MLFLPFYFQILKMNIRLFFCGLMCFNIPAQYSIQRTSVLSDVKWDYISCEKCGFRGGPIMWLNSTMDSVSVMV